MCEVTGNSSTGHNVSNFKYRTPDTMDKEKKKWRHSKATPVAKEKKKRRRKDIFSFLRHRNRKDYDKVKSSVENISSLPDTIPSFSRKSGVVNDAFILDAVQIGGNSFHTSLVSVAAAASSVSDNSSTNDENQCMSVVSAANSDETLNETPRYLGTPCIQCFHSQHQILELSNDVAQLSVEKERQTLSHQREIQQITLTNGSKMEKLEEMIGTLMAENSSLKEVNTSLMGKVLWTEDENFILKEELQERRKQCSDFKSENAKIHENMTNLMQKFGKVKRELSTKNNKCL